MKSDYYFRLLTRQNLWARQVWASPFEFSLDNRILKVDSKAKQRFILSFGVFCIQTRFMTSRTLCQVFKLEKKNETNFYYLIVVSLAANLSIQILSQTAWKPEGIAQVFHSLTYFFRRIQGKQKILGNILKAFLSSKNAFFSRNPHADTRSKHFVPKLVL